MIYLIIGIKIRLEPNNKQNTKLFQSANTARWAYNWTLQRQQDNYKEGNKFIQDGYLRKELTQLKKTEEFKWLNKVSCNVPKQAIKDACDAYKKFFKGLSKHPKFKSKKENKLAFYNDNICLKVKNNKVLIERVGWIKTSELIPKNKYHNPRITFDGLHWYLSVGIEKEQSIKEELQGSIGVDLGIKELAVVSNGLVVPNINKSTKIKKLERHKKKLQKKVSKKYKINKKGESYIKTNNIKKLEKRILKLNRKITNIRNDYIHKFTTSLVRTKPERIVIEDLNVRGMMKNHKLAKAIQEQSFYEIRRQLTYKCEWNNIELVIANRFYPSSKTCSECGYIKPKLSLSERTYKCECCGLEIDRDLNAAINLSKYKVI